MGFLGFLSHGLLDIDMLSYGFACSLACQPACLLICYPCTHTYQYGSTTLIKSKWKKSSSMIDAHTRARTRRLIIRLHKIIKKEAACCGIALEQQSHTNENAIIKGKSNWIKFHPQQHWFTSISIRVQFHPEAFCLYVHFCYVFRWICLFLFLCIHFIQYEI